MAVRPSAGRITQRAVLNYQRTNRLTVDGVAGQQTQTHIGM
jgi:peptidoglycan hydrolase-like protein with peptidoglycan-binding domain